jgi:uncharacterized protein YkwD
MARLAALVLVLTLLGGGTSAARVSDTNPGSRTPSSAKVTSAKLEQSILLAVNDQRRLHGLDPLRLSRSLAAAAREHSLSMAEHGFFDHTSFDGSSFWQRIRQAYPPVNGRSWAAGENLAWASPDMSARHVVDMWLASPLHRRNLLAPSWREAGIGTVHAVAAPGVYEGRKVTIVTADFGAR